MKKTKPILALLSALALLLAAACEQSLSSSGADLDNFHDVRTNQSYTNNVISSNNVSSNYFPDITVSGGGSIGASGLVEIDFTTASSYAASGSRLIGGVNVPQTLDILLGNVEENIKKAIFFEGVTHADATVATARNAYTDISYSIESIQGKIVSVKLSSVVYDAVRPYVKASEYKISGNPIDTDGNFKGGETPYDDYYYDSSSSKTLLSCATTPTVPASRIDRPNTKADFTMTLASTPGNATTPYILYAQVTDTTDTASYDKLKDYITLEVWDPASKSWTAASSITGAYTSTGVATPIVSARSYYFSIPYDDNGYKKYRVVATNLHTFETDVVKGFKRRFATYPVMVGTGSKVTIHDGKKALVTLPLSGATYDKSHSIKGNVFETSSPSHFVVADAQKKNAVLYLEVNMAATGPLGDKGFSSSIDDSVATFNANFKLAYDQQGNTKYINITKVELRDIPGSSIGAGGVKPQQLVLTLDPGYEWVNSRQLTVYAKDGIEFAGNADASKTAGKLGDANGFINIDGSYNWGQYGTLTITL
jgi:hypothetical protein